MEGVAVMFNNITTIWICVVNTLLVEGERAPQITNDFLELRKLASPLRFGHKT